MRRREFITLMGGATAAWPLTARAQQPAMPVVGFLRNTTASSSAVRRQVAVIVGSSLAVTRAVKAATVTTPIVFVLGADPVRTGLVANLNRPGGNITGVVFTSNDLVAKQLGLLHELVPKAAVIAVLLDVNAAEIELQAERRGGGGSCHRAANPDRENRK
jgi:putative ABC transport system substrate-binding protein